jgi:drug/metabolite transporter (DMT)-like permease
MMSWQVAILVHQLLETAYALLYRRYAREHSGDYLTANAAMYLLTVVPFGLIWSASQGGPHLDFSVSVWGLLFLAGVLFATSNGLAFMANARIEASRFAVMNSISPIVTIVASTAILSEGLRLRQVLGALVIILAALVAILTQRRDTAFRLDVHIGLAFASAVFLGLAVTDEKFILGQMSLAGYVVFGWGLQAIFMLVLMRGSLSPLFLIVRSRRLRSILVLGLLRAIAGFAFLNALIGSGNASLVAAVVSLQAVLVTLGGYLFLGERDRALSKLAAAAAAAVGVLLVIR